MEVLSIRPDEAGRALGIGRSKIYDLIARGELPSVRIGRSIRIPVKALRDWVDANSSVSQHSGFLED